MINLKNRQNSPGDKSANLLMITVSLIAVGIVVIFTIWKINDADNAMRNALLKQTRLAAAGLNPGVFDSLSGGEADLKKNSYLKLKKRLNAIREADKKSRFVYLLGINGKKQIFFFADNEPPASKDYSPPGQIYNEASPELRNIFKTGQEITEGPLADRWGTWVTALVPIKNRNTGKIAAILGMDIDARGWKWDIISSSSLPIILMLILLILLFQVLFVFRSRCFIRQNREFLKTQLEEKELLLRETHHRIMNNLTAIHEMIYLQATSTSNDEAASILQDTMGMISGMGKLYKKMLVEKSYREISIRLYLHDLIDSISALFPGATAISIIKKIDDFPINSRQLFPLGIIINELLTNSFKYAFPDGGSGKLTVTASEKNGMVTISISDNGRGLPEDFNPEKSDRFGLDLVKMLGIQLHADISFRNENGSKTVINFPKQPLPAKNR